MIKVINEPNSVCIVSISFQQNEQVGTIEIEGGKQYKHAINLHGFENINLKLNLIAENINVRILVRGDSKYNPI